MPRTSTMAGGQRETRTLVIALTVAAFGIFFQAFMVAPILPALAGSLNVTTGAVGLAIPAYLIPYGLMSLVWGPVTDRIGRRPVIVGSLAAFTVVTVATATASNVAWFVVWRVAAGVVASGVIPVSVALLADLVPYASRGHALGWLFGGMAGGMAVGSTVGALVQPFLGWRGLFVVVAVGMAVTTVTVGAIVPSQTASTERKSLRQITTGYAMLLRNARGRRTYAYVGLNALIQSGIYAWLGVYLDERYSLGSVGIGLALLGYGIPGFLFGPAIGRAADRHGRARLIPLGVALGAMAAFALATPLPLIVAAVVIAVLSLGYDLTQPLLAGIVTDLPGPAGQSVALMAVILFSGFGLGSLAFQAALTGGFTLALVTFGGIATYAAVAALPLFADERGHRPDQAKEKISE